jgi:L-amino acid N-acyltransferase YncA
VIRFAAPGDAAAVAAIYAPYVEGQAVSLETEAPDALAMAARIAAGGALHPWLVACGEDGAVAGYAAASGFRPRPGYRFTVETSVYVAMERQGMGIGRTLLDRLIALLERQGFTQAIAAITLPNLASARLHEALGFERCGVYGRVAWKLGRWWDVGLWQRALAPAQDPPPEPRPYAEVSAGIL